jgi:hypothetical protein
VVFGVRNANRRRGKMGREFVLAWGSKGEGINVVSVGGDDSMEFVYTRDQMRLWRM